MVSKLRMLWKQTVGHTSDVHLLLLLLLLVVVVVVVSMCVLALDDHWGQFLHDRRENGSLNPIHHCMSKP